MEIELVSIGFSYYVTLSLRCGGIEHKKDPGIPNNFPYKDQILAEVQEQRRLVRAAHHLRSPFG